MFSFEGWGAFPVAWTKVISVFDQKKIKENFCLVIKSLDPDWIRIHSSGSFVGIFSSPSYSMSTNKARMSI